MTYATMFDLDGNTLSDGLQTGARCDEALHLAKRHARETKRSVIVEDYGTHECYRVTPAGHIWRAPKTWPAPAWVRKD